MIRTTPAARRYAEAAFELATRDGSQDAWRDGLRLAAAILGDPAAAAVLDDPARPFAQRREVLDRLIGGRVTSPVANLVRLLAARGRLDALPAVGMEYERLLNRQRGILEAMVTSAVPLSTEETAALRARVQAMTGSAIDLQSIVDPSLIGGLTVRVGDRLIDASVRGRLERLRTQLVTGTR